LFCEKIEAMKKSILITNGHLIDPKNGIDEIYDVRIENGVIESVGKNLAAADETIDASGKVVCPGLIDLQVHLREPGREDKETIETGLQSALAGGITSVVSMPNLNPVADNQAVIEFQIHKAQKLNLANLYPTGAITKGQKGLELAEMREMKLAGAVAVTDDGVDVQNAGVLEKAMEWAKTFDLPLLSHCEEVSLHAGEGVVHEGEWSTKLGLTGVSAEVEDYGVFRNVLLAEKTGVQFHALHCSTKKGLEIIAEAKARGANITCETCPQYFALTDAIVDGYNTNAKMYPPIRSQEHQDAVIERLKDGTIDCISTDHAPHIRPEKLQPFAAAAYGSVGLETSLAIGITYLVEKGHITMSQLIEKMSANPAKVIRIDRGHLGVGAVADITIFDPKKEWTVNPEEFKTKARNCVFSGMKLTGKTTDVFVAGEKKL
jgi:dihydroorotase